MSSIYSRHAGSHLTAKMLKHIMTCAVCKERLMLVKGGVSPQGAIDKTTLRTFMGHVGEAKQ